MVVNNVSVSSVFAPANRGVSTSVLTRSASETPLVRHTTTSSGSGTETSSGPASTYTSTEIFNHESQGNQDCYPLPVGTRRRNRNEYSPEVCPSGWTSSCTQNASALGFSTAVYDDQTAILCCPENYNCAGTAFTRGQTVTKIWSSPTAISGVPLDIPYQHPLVPNPSPKEMSIISDPIAMRQNARDLSPREPSPTGLLIATGTPLFTPSSNSISIPSSPTAAPPADSEGTPMSTSAKTAIGIVIPLAFISLLLFIYLFYRYRRRKLRPRVRHDLSSPAPTYFTSPSTTWTSPSHSSSQAHLIPVYKQSTHTESQAHLIPVHNPTSKPSTPIYNHNHTKIPDDPEHVPDIQPPAPIYSASAHSLRSSHSAKLVEIGPSKNEWAMKMEGIVELADTSRKSVKEWARRSVWSVKSSRSKGPPPEYEEGGNGRVGRSWFEDGPPSPAFVKVTSPVRARFG